MSRTLIVTASLPLAKRLQDLMTTLGRETLIAHTHEAALRHFRRGKPELAVVDAIMPDIPGLEIAQGFIFENSETRIVVMSDIDTNVIRDVALRCGARDVLIKPFSDFEFEFTIQKYLEDFDAESA